MTVDTALLVDPGDEQFERLLGRLAKNAFAPLIAANEPILIAVLACALTSEMLAKTMVADTPRRKCFTCKNCFI
ncbi:hypothetical protein ACFFWD_43880 [Bradyrhizobium erythrophlei]|uniref:hypothetical protein n=1 Tax=Bradyrhizobium erythrophlei TaxID=1437360 RepID=UPI0035E59EB7